MDFAAARRTMVDNQVRTYDVTDKLVLAAFETVPREAFTMPDQAAIAYSDQPLTARAGGAVRTGVPPLVLARMLQAAEPQPGERALVVAGGTGYAAALLAEMGLSVTLLEENAELAAAAAACVQAAGASVAVVHDHLQRGHVMSAPYDLIVVEGAMEVEPDALLKQLADEGRLVGVLGLGRSARVKLFTRRRGAVGSRTVFDAAAPAIDAFRAEQAFVF